MSFLETISGGGLESIVKLRGGDHRPSDIPLVKFRLRFFKYSFLFLFLLFFLSFLLLNIGTSGTAAAADQENCMFCHQYPLLGTVDDNGTYNSFYVGEDHYMGSVHAELRCSECHKDITKIPHETETKVNCSNVCHIEEPSIGRQFSHQIIEDELKNSAHGIDYAYLNAKGDPADFPVCISCHVNEENKVILSSRKNMEHVVMAQAQGKCYDCHSDLNIYVEKSLIHILRKTERVKNQKEIMAMCVSCHDNQELNERHKLVNAIYSYLENYHGKTMVLGLENAPSCIDCHVKLGESPHAIKSVRDPISATYAANRGNMCLRADCHPNADPGMGKSYIHVVPTDEARFPIQFWLMVFFTILTIGSFVGLMIILIMELFRMIFPNFTIIKQRSNDDEHE